MKSSVVLGEVVSLSPWSACPAQPLLWEPCIAATLGDHGLVIDIGRDRQLPPHGVCCWHAEAHNLFSQSHGFQSSGL